MLYDIIVVGAGIVGLSTALNILEKNPGTKLLILEKESRIASHQTGNNSGVIHSGIYYRPGSKKAVNCLRGYELLLKFCDRNEINYDICGKVIVATDKNELTQLKVLEERGKENGLSNLKRIQAEELKEIEPHVQGLEALFVPQTGIIDYLEVSKKMLLGIEELGGELKLNTEVNGITRSSGKIEIISTSSVYLTKKVVSCAGLQSDRISRYTHPDLSVRIIPFRGEYYKLKNEKRYLVNSLIYPVPNPEFPFLGVHFTRMINGEVEAGPNAVLAMKREGYRKLSFNLKDSMETFLWPGFRKVAVDYWKTGMGEFYRSFSKKAFVRALQKLIPEITKDDLIPGGAGVRAQACDRKGGLLDDFYIIQGENVSHVCNAPSPAATSSLAIGEYISGMILN